MGLSAVLENERGEPLERVDDPKNVLHRILPSAEDSSFQMLRFIDWYGDTTFNYLQMEVFLAELERLNRVVQTNEDQELLNRIRELAERSQAERHLYLKFYGD